jgi:hypothetical protein
VLSRTSVIISACFRGFPGTRASSALAIDGPFCAGRPVPRPPPRVGHVSWFEVKRSLLVQVRDSRGSRLMARSAGLKRADHDSQRSAEVQCRGTKLPGLPGSIPFEDFEKRECQTTFQICNPVGLLALCLHFSVSPCNLVGHLYKKVEKVGKVACTEKERGLLATFF